jgi:hypothetical protein
MVLFLVNKIEKLPKELMLIYYIIMVFQYLSCTSSSISLFRPCIRKFWCKTVLQLINNDGPFSGTHPHPGAPHKKGKRRLKKNPQPPPAKSE